LDIHDQLCAAAVAPLFLANHAKAFFRSRWMLVWSVKNATKQEFKTRLTSALALVKIVPVLYFRRNFCPENRFTFAGQWL